MADSEGRVVDGEGRVADSEGRVADSEGWADSEGRQFLGHHEARRGVLFVPSAEDL